MPATGKRKRTSTSSQLYNHNPSTTFHQFSRLPPELRRLIWSFAIVEDAAPAIFPCTHVWVNWYSFIQQGQAGLTSTTADAQHKTHPCVVVETPPMAFACREAREAVCGWVKSHKYRPVLNQLNRPSSDSTTTRPAAISTWFSTSTTTPSEKADDTPERTTRKPKGNIHFVRVWDVNRDVMYLDDDIMFIFAELERHQDDPIWAHLLTVAIDVRHIAIRVEKDKVVEIKAKLSAMMPLLKNLQTLYCIAGEPPTWVAPFRTSLVANLPNNAITDVTYPRLKIMNLNNTDDSHSLSSEGAADSTDTPREEPKPHNMSAQTFTHVDAKRKRTHTSNEAFDWTNDFIDEICEGWNQGDVKVYAALVVESVAE